MSRAATYVSTNGGPLFRFSSKDRPPVRLFDQEAEVADVLGSAAFISVGTGIERQLVLDRPSARDSFVTRSLGVFRGPIAAGSDDRHYDVAAHAGDHVAAAADGVVTFYDEAGHVRLAVLNQCRGPRHVLVSQAVAFILCSAGSSSAPTLAAYSFP